MQYKSVPLALKAAPGEDGVFEGYASVFGVVDLGMDVVEKIHRLKDKGQRILEPLPFTLSMKGEG